MKHPVMAFAFCLNIQPLFCVICRKRIKSVSIFFTNEHFCKIYGIMV